MLTLDYETAWHAAAKPAYEALPQNLRDLLARTAHVAADLHQLTDCSMPWPDPDQDPVAGDVSGVLGFREAFRKVPAEYLALAAQVIHNVGHWYPGASAQGFEVPGREAGACWKFAHYADQELRERLGLPARGSNGRGRGWGYEVHEGAIRVTFSEPRSWSWVEVAPATAAGLAYARDLVQTWQREIDAEQPDRRCTNDRGNIRYRLMEAYRTLPFARPEVWPEAWRPFVGGQYMADEETIKARTAAKPEVRTKTRARIVRETAQKIADLERNRDGMLWFLDHGIPVENCIYYSHTNTFTFGWRAPVPADQVSAILDVISEFPYPYAIKCADGRTLEGGQG